MDSNNRIRVSFTKPEAAAVQAVVRKEVSAKLDNRHLDYNLVKAMIKLQRHLLRKEAQN